MSTIKKALEIAGISLLTFLGADKVLAQDSTNAVPNTSKNKIEMTQAITQPDTARVDTILIKEFYHDSGDGEVNNPWAAKVRAKQVEGKIVSGDTSINLIPFDSTATVQFGLNPILQKDRIKLFIQDTKADSAQIDTLRDTRKFSPIKKPASKIIPKKENRIYSDDKNFGAFLGGIFGAQIQPNMIVTPDYQKNLNPLFSSANKDSLEFEFMPAKKALKNAGIYLKPIVDSTGAGKIINYQRRVIKSKLENIAKDSLYKSAEYDSSLQILNDAVRDGIIKGSELFDAEGNCKVKDGLYVLNVKSKPSKGYNGNSFPIILDITSQKDRKNLILNVYGFPAFFVGYEDSIKQVTFENNKPVEKDSAVIPTQSKTDSILEPSKVPETKPSKKSDLSLIVGGHVGQNGFKGVDLGIQHGKFAGVVNYSVAGDENLETITGSTSSTGMQGTVETNNIDYKAFFGMALEYHPSDFFIGAGIEPWKYATIRGVKITRSDGTVKRKTDPEKANSEIAGKGYVGYGKNISRNTKLEGLAGYDSKKGFFGGARLNFNLRK